MEYQSIGNRIKQRRTELGLKQLQIKEITGISSGNLSDIENGKKLPSTPTLIALANILDCSIDWLLTGKNSSISANSKSNVPQPDTFSEFNKLVEKNYSTDMTDNAFNSFCTGLEANDLKDRIRKRIVFRMGFLNLDIKNLKKMSGISEKNISDILQGNKIPTIFELHFIAKALCCTMDFFFEDNNASTFSTLVTQPEFYLLKEFRELDQYEQKEISALLQLKTEKMNLKKTATNNSEYEYEFEL